MGSIDYLQDYFPHMVVTGDEFDCGISDDGVVIAGRQHGPNEATVEYALQVAIGYDEQRAAALQRAVGELSREQTGLSVEALLDEPGFSFLVSVGRHNPKLESIPTLGEIFDHFSRDIAAGIDPFLSLARRDGHLSKASTTPSIAQAPTALSVRLIPGVEPVDLADALRHMLERRHGVAVATVLMTNVVEVQVADSDHHAVKETLGRWQSLLDAGADPADVFELAPSVAPTSAAKASRVVAASAVSAAESVIQPACGNTKDLYLLDVGYDESRVEQLICLLLSVDIITARTVCASTPCPLMVDLGAEEAEKFRGLLSRAGGRVTVVRSGTRPRGFR